MEEDKMGENLETIGKLCKDVSKGVKKTAKIAGKVAIYTPLFLGDTLRGII